MKQVIKSASREEQNRFFLNSEKSRWRVKPCIASCPQVLFHCKSDRDNQRLLPPAPVRMSDSAAKEPERRNKRKGMIYEMKGCLAASLWTASPCSYTPVKVLNVLEMWIRALSLISSKCPRYILPYIYSPALAASKRHWVSIIKGRIFNSQSLH